MCIVQHAQTEIVFTLQPLKLPVFYDCKNCKAGSHVLNTPFRDEKLVIVFLVVMVHIATQEKGVVSTKSPFLKKTLRQSQPSTRGLEQKKAEIVPLMA